MPEMEFKEWMETSTKLLDSSIRVYDRTIKEYFSQHDRLELGKINEFIAHSFRQSRSPHKKYAFKHYMKFKGQTRQYKKLVKARIMPRKKKGTHLPSRTVQKIIHNIENEKCRDVATLLYATGARAIEILSLQDKDIDLDYSVKIIRITVIGKGAKEGFLPLSKSYQHLLERYMGDDGYLFLSSSANLADEPDIIRMLTNARAYLYEQIKKSALSIGINGFGTHDFRRNVAQNILKKTHNIMQVKNVLRHSNIMTSAIYLSESMEEIQDTMLEHQAEVHHD